MKNKKKLSDGRLTAQCLYCNRTIVSMTDGQLKWNLAKHEEACRFNSVNVKARSEVERRMK